MPDPLRLILLPRPRRVWVKSPVTDDWAMLAESKRASLRVLCFLCVRSRGQTKRALRFKARTPSGNHYSRENGDSNQLPSFCENFPASGHCLHICPEQREPSPSARPIVLRNAATGGRMSSSPHATARSTWGYFVDGLRKSRERSVTHFRWTHFARAPSQVRN